MKIMKNFNGRGGMLKRAISTVIFATLLSAGVVSADAVDDAAAADLADLCQDKNANELSKIASKKSNSQEMRRNALERMMEVSRQCSNASDNRLRQYHQKAIGAAHELLDESEVDTRRIAIDCIQFIAMQPDSVMPSEGSITRGQALSNAALNDSDTGVRLWALEAMVTLRGDHPTVQSTLAAAANDSEPVVRETASNMLAELY